MESSQDRGDQEDAELLRSELVGDERVTFGLRQKTKKCVPKYSGFRLTFPTPLYSSENEKDTFLMFIFFLQQLSFLIETLQTICFFDDSAHSVPFSMFVVKLRVDYLLKRPEATCPNISMS